MKSVRRLVLSALVAAALSACGGGDEGDSGANSNITLPRTLVGQVITYTVTNSGTAGIPVGYKIEWTFSSGGVIRGKNPVTGQVVTPSSYTYEVRGSDGYADVRYVQGTQTAYEIYRMTGVTSSSGTYTYEGNTGTGVKTAAGTYSVR
jgi:hypothetical protein